jgi:mono/diheme cytochrome c family protein
MKPTIIAFALLLGASFAFYNCTTSTSTASSNLDSTNARYGGYANQLEWGKHLVIISGCADCHTPKKMTAQGPAPDLTRDLSGSSSPALIPDIKPDQVAKGMAATVDLTAWVGPWGKSFAANITSDSTGIGNWTEQQFTDCLRKGLYKGLSGTRPLMPPMPWQDFSQMTDDEIKAVFAYLKSTKPVHNVVPQYEPPVAMKQ